MERLYRQEELVHSSGRSQVLRVTSYSNGGTYALKSGPLLSGFGIQQEAAVAHALRSRSHRADLHGLVLPLSSFREGDRLVLVLPFADFGDAAFAFSGRASGSLPAGTPSFLWRIARDLTAGVATMHALGEQNEWRGEH